MLIWMMMILIGNRLKELRKKLGLAQEDFASILSLSPKAYWNYENDKRSLPTNI